MRLKETQTQVQTNRMAQIGCIYFWQRRAITDCRPHMCRSPPPPHWQQQQQQQSRLQTLQRIHWNNKIVNVEAERRKEGIEKETEGKGELGRAKPVTHCSCPALPCPPVSSYIRKMERKKKRNETKLDDVDANVDVDPHWIIGFGCGGAVVRRRRRRHPHTAARDEMTRRRHAGEYNTPSNWLAALMQFLSSLLFSSLHSTKVKKKREKMVHTTALHCTALGLWLHCYFSIQYYNPHLLLIFLVPPPQPSPPPPPLLHCIVSN